MTTTTRPPTPPTPNPSGPDPAATRRPAPRETWWTRVTQAPAPEGNPAIVGTGFAMLAIVCAWVLLQTLVLSGVSHDRAQTLLYNKFRSELGGLSLTPVPLGTRHCDLNDPTSPLCAIPEGEPVTILSIPSIGLNEVVVEGTSSGDLLDGPGHLRTTVLPGQVGTSTVMGRSLTYGAPFAKIADLHPGDEVNITTGQGVKTLKVVDVRHDGDPVPAALAAGSTRLVMVTSEGSGGFLSSLTAGKTLYVDADATEGQIAPGNLPAQVPDTDNAMARDTGALPLLALFLALLLALTVAVIAARQRWSAALVWVIASPVAVALAWMSTDTVMRLLPNLT